MATSTHLPPPLMMESTEVRKWVTHMLCWTCAMYFSAAVSSENDQGKPASLRRRRDRRDRCPAENEEAMTLLNSRSQSVAGRGHDHGAILLQVPPDHAVGSGARRPLCVVTVAAQRGH